MKIKILSLGISVFFFLASCAPENNPFMDGLIPGSDDITATIQPTNSIDENSQAIATATSIYPLQGFIDGLIPDNSGEVETPITNSGSQAKTVKFENVTEDIQKLPYKIYPLNNCNGSAELEQTVTNTFTHEIIDQTKEKLGIEIPISVWFTIVSDIEHHYGVTNTTEETVTIKLIALAGESVEYKLIHEQIWESGTIITQVANQENVASYKILKGETFGIATSEKKACP